MEDISPNSLPRDGSGEFCLIDVRTPAEFAEFHVRGAQNLPLDKISPDSVRALRGAKEVPIYLLCRTGSRAAKAGRLLTDAGFPKVFCVAGGSEACRDSGVECISGERRVISLERQVRIAAGALVLCGVLFGFSLHPGFYGLSAFVGAGLVIAGLTDWCGMALLLARMPWNR